MLTTVEQSLVHIIRLYWLCLPKKEKKYHHKHITQQEISLQLGIMYILLSSKFPFSTVVEYQVIGHRS
jgi:hypothetical protein